VPRRENLGLTLKHHNVVRKFETTKLVQTEEVEISLPNNFDPTKLLLVVYIQDKELKIIGAKEMF
jgi:hypothetical protein